MKIKQASFLEVKEAVDQNNAILIDVRTQEEWDEGHLEGFILIPLQEFTPEKVKKLLQGRDKNIYLLCRSGGRSAEAAEILLSNGFEKVFNVKGGILACKEGMFPFAKS